MKHHSTFLRIFFLLMTVSSVLSQTADEFLKQTIDQKAFQAAELGIIIKNFTTDEVILHHQSKKLLTPASILKTMVSARALTFFSPNHTFATRVYLIGSISNSIFYGDILLKGFGDMTLGSEMRSAVQAEQIISDIYQQLKKLGVTCVFGQVVADASYFSLPGIPSGYIQEDVANYYGAGIYGLNYQDNGYEIVFDRKKSGVGVLRYDSLAVNEVNSTVTARGTSDQAYIYFSPNESSVQVVGSIPAGKGPFVIKGAIRNPPFYLAKLVQKSLENSGIEFQNAARAVFSPYTVPGDVLWQKEFLSPPLKDILIQVMHKSNNVYAEALHRHLLKLDESYVFKRAILDDGSGLSPTNRISAENLLQEMESVLNSSNKDSFMSVFPVNAVSGNVRSVLKSNPGKLHIKSGSIGGVRAYAGIRRTKEGNIVGFVLMANELQSKGSSARKAWEPLLSYIANL